MIGIILTAALLLLFHWVLRDWLRWRRAGGFGTYWPLVGHLPTLLAQRDDIFVYFRDTYRRLGFPDLLIVKVGPWQPPRVLTINPKDVEHMLKTKFDNYHVAAGLRGGVLRDFLGDGIFNSDDEMWHLQRKLAAREFSANRFRNFMAEVFLRNANKMCDAIARKVDSWGSERGACIDLHQWFFTLTLDAFSEIAFGIDVGGLDGKPQPFIAAFDKCQEQIFNRCLHQSGYWRIMKALNIGPERDMKEALRTIDTFVYSLMDDLLAGKRALATPEAADQEDDLLRRLLPAAKKDDGTYDRKLVRDMLLNLIIAGRDTTAASMSWTMLELMRQPQHVHEIREELESALGPNGAPNFDNVADCHYLQCVLSESQRLHPSVPWEPRTAMADDELPSGYKVKKGDTVTYLNLIMGISEPIWGRDADKFKPSRWVKSDGSCRKEDPFKFPAFNAGRRLCLGVDMANLEMKVVLAVLLRRFEFELVPNQTITPASALTLQMKHGMKAFVRHRNKLAPMR